MTIQAHTLWFPPEAAPGELFLATDGRTWKYLPHRSGWECQTPAAPATEVRPSWAQHMQEEIKR